MADNKNPVDEVLKIFKNGWNRQVILYGPPGTSKTYSSTIIAAAMLDGSFDTKAENAYDNASDVLKDNERYKFVQFHPSYSYEDFVRGITVKTDNGTIKYEPEAKIIEKFCKVCNNHKDEECVMVIDEINRAPLASVLGELIYGLEYRGEEFTTPYEIGTKATLSIPDNLYIIGTMNTADRSIGSIDYAVRRRFAFVQVPSEPNAIAGSWKEIGKDVENLYDDLMDAENGIFSQKFLADPETDVADIKIGHTYFLSKGKNSNLSPEDEIAYMNYRIDYQIRPIYMEYIKDGIITKEGEKKFDEIIKEFRKSQTAQ